MSASWLVFGLGNPPEQYRLTRHNIGQLAVENLTPSFSKHKSLAETSTLSVGDHSAIIARSLGYMNDSGRPIKALADFYKIPLDHIIVLHDELDLPFGAIRVKMAGGDNGHNGLKSATANLGGPGYLRVRLGIGRPEGFQPPADYVLKQFTSEEKKSLPEFLDRAVNATKSLIVKGLSATQQEFNN